MKLHRSKTGLKFFLMAAQFCYHMKLHRSKTGHMGDKKRRKFCYHMKLHRSKTSNIKSFAIKNFATI